MSRSRRRLHSSDDDLSSSEPVNVGAGEDITIAEFARVVAATVGYTGEISFDPRGPTTRRANCSMSVGLPTGLARPYPAPGWNSVGLLSSVSQRIETAGRVRFIRSVGRARWIFPERRHCQDQRLHEVGVVDVPLALGQSRLWFFARGRDRLAYSMIADAQDHKSLLWMVRLSWTRTMVLTLAKSRSAFSFKT